MKVKSIVKCSKEHSAILLTCIKLPFVIKIFVLSIFEWSFYTGLTVYAKRTKISRAGPHNLAIWVKVQNLKKILIFRNSKLKTCYIPTKYKQFQV